MLIWASLLKRRREQLLNLRHSSLFPSRNLLLVPLPPPPPLLLPRRRLRRKRPNSKEVDVYNIFIKKWLVWRSPSSLCGCNVIIKIAYYYYYYDGLTRGKLRQLRDVREKGRKREQALRESIYHDCTRLHQHIIKKNINYENIINCGTWHARKTPSWPQRVWAQGRTIWPPYHMLSIALLATHCNIDVSTLIHTQWSMW